MVCRSTSAPAGGEKANTSSSTAAYDTRSKPNESVGSAAPRAVTSTRSGTKVRPSIAAWIEPSAVSAAAGVMVSR